MSTARGFGQLPALVAATPTAFPNMICGTAAYVFTNTDAASIFIGWDDTVAGPAATGKYFYELKTGERWPITCTSTGLPGDTQFWFWSSAGTAAGALKWGATL